MTPNGPLDPDHLADLDQASTATISTQLFKLGLRNTFMAGVRPLNPGAPRLIGEAFTLRYIPAREDLDVVDAFANHDHPQRTAIELVGPGQVLVIDARGDGRAASAGHILLTRMAVRGAAGLVTDGTVRDIAGIRSLPLPVFGTGAAAMMNLALHHAVEHQVPIGCAGVPVYPGDVLVGDDDGVVCIPRHLVPVIASAARDQEQLEEYLQRKVADGAPLHGTYPPDAATQRAYRQRLAAYLDQQP